MKLGHWTVYRARSFVQQKTTRSADGSANNLRPGGPVFENIVRGLTSGVLATHFADQSDEVMRSKSSKSLETKQRQETPCENDPAKT